MQNPDLLWFKYDIHWCIFVPYPVSFLVLWKFIVYLERFGSFSVTVVLVWCPLLSSCGEGLSRVSIQEYPCCQGYPSLSGGWIPVPSGARKWNLPLVPLKEADTTDVDAGWCVDEGPVILPSARQPNKLRAIVKQILVVPSVIWLYWY